MNDDWEPGPGEDWPSSEQSLEAWHGLPQATLGMRLVVRRPDDVWPVVRPWLGELAEVTRPFVDESGPSPYARYSRSGIRLDGKRIPDIEPAALENMRVSYEKFAGGAGSWDMGDREATADGVIGLASASVFTDDDDQIEGNAHLNLIDRGGVGLPAELEEGWAEFLRKAVATSDVLYGEIVSPASALYFMEGLTAYEERTGRPPTWRVIHEQVETRLRGCGWVTWIPERFASVLGGGKMRESGLFHSVTEVDDKGVLVQATKRSSEYTEEKARIIEEFLHPVLEPEGSTRLQ